jgi:hypothetical protein
MMVLRLPRIAKLSREISAGECWIQFPPSPSPAQKFAVNALGSLLRGHLFLFAINNGLPTPVGANASGAAQMRQKAPMGRHGLNLC